jgi:hypothetical protein
MNYYSNQNLSPVGESKAPLVMVERDNKLWHLFSFIQEAYGNDTSKLLTSIDSFLVFDFLLKYVKNKKLRFGIQALKWGIPAFINGSQFYLLFKNYLKQTKDEKSPTYQKHMAKICKVLEIKETDPRYLDLYEISCNIAPDIIYWILTKPNTEKIKIINVFNMENTVEVDSVNLSGDGQFDIAILFNYMDVKYVLDLNLLIIDSFPFIKAAVFYTVSVNSNQSGMERCRERELREVFLCEFINKLDIPNNILYFSSLDSIECEPRIKVEENINQFNIYDFVKEIKQILDCGRKRAYAFVSRPGTGKSTIIRKLEELMTDYVFFKLTPDDFNAASKIKDRFKIIKNINKSVVIIEDLDSCELQDKNSRAGVFLDEIDDVNNNLNIVMIVTINDTSRVHFSIINRPGRFDRVIEIKPPSTIEEIHQVMLSKAKKLKRNYCPDSKFNIPELADIDYKLLSTCLSNEYTQAEITNAIVEQIFIYISMSVLEKKLKWDSISNKQFNKLFKKAIESHMKTKEAIKNCNFNNAPPATDNTDNELTKCEEATDLYPTHRKKA